MSQLTEGSRSPSSDAAFPVTPAAPGEPADRTPPAPNWFKRFFSKLYNWVALMIVLGAVVGHFWPSVGVAMQPVAEGFIALIKMLIPPVILCTVVLGISGAGGIRKAGRVGAKALIYFEVVSALALVVGLVMAHLFGPGHSFHAQPSQLDPKLVAGYVEKAGQMTVADHLLHTIPRTLFSAFTEGDILQVLLVALLLGFALTLLPAHHARPIVRMFESIKHLMFGVMHLVLYLAPLGAGAAIAFTIGKFGLRSLIPLGSLIVLFYATCALFVFVVLGTIARVAGFNILLLLRYIKNELLLVLATSSSESALIPLMEKLERLGLSRSVVGLVVPTGYSFNLDGTNIYMTLASIFIAQALGIELTLGQQLHIIIVAMITSKGASGVTGAGFITLAATLAAVPSIPVVGMALILGIDKFMSEARAITNHIGNCTAAVLMAIWEKEIDWPRFKSELAAGSRSSIGLLVPQTCKLPGFVFREPDDDGDVKLLRDVREHGWHVVGVPDDGAGPGFSFTVGLSVRTLQPEILIMGVPIEPSHRVLNAIAEFLMAGGTLTTETRYSDFVDGREVLFRPIHQSQFREYLGYANWFYRPSGVSFPAFQCIWPDLKGLWPDEHGFDNRFAGRQLNLSLPRT